MDPEEMKQQWNDLNKRIEALEDANSWQIDRMRLSKLKTAQDRLVSTYHRSPYNCMLFHGVFCNCRTYGPLPVEIIETARLQHNGS